LLLLALFYFTAVAQTLKKWIKSNMKSRVYVVFSRLLSYLIAFSELTTMTYYQDTNIGTATTACQWLFAGITLLTIILAVWSRLLSKGPFRSDDYLIWLAYVISVVSAAQTQWAIQHEGEGNHIQYESSSQVAMVATVCVKFPSIDESNEHPVTLGE
jgi:Na+/melibiose symporter-like transporter